MASVQTLSLGTPGGIGGGSGEALGFVRVANLATLWPPLPGCAMGRLRMQRLIDLLAARGLRGPLRRAQLGPAEVSVETGENAVISGIRAHDPNLSHSMRAGDGVLDAGISGVHHLALANVRNAIEAWIEGAHEMGRAVPTPSRKAA